MGKGFWIWQGTAWTAVIALALVMLLWESGRMKSPSAQGNFPVRALDVRMDKSGYDRFAVQMREFGTAFGFKMLIKPGSPRPYDLFFQMRRHDVDLLASRDPDTGATDVGFQIGFYPKRDQPPPAPEHVATLVEGLRQYLDQVPGAAVTEVTRPR